MGAGEIGEFCEKEGRGLLSPQCVQYILLIFLFLEYFEFLFWLISCCVACKFEEVINEERDVKDEEDE